MLAKAVELARQAQQDGYALGAFNIYNLEGVKAVVAAAEASHSPVMLQIHAAALRYGGQPLIALCLAQARQAAVPVAVHLDHSRDVTDITLAIQTGVTSVMADGAHLDYDDNVTFVRQVVALAGRHQVGVEAELGLISGTEDGLSVADYEARMTDPDQAAAYVQATGIDLLAVCVGNVHGRYHGEPNLDFVRLAAIQARVAVPLVMHGASGLPEDMIQRAIELGVCKFNVNTELRAAYLEAVDQFGGQGKDLLDLLQAAVENMQAVVAHKLRLFGSTGRVSSI